MKNNEKGGTLRAAVIGAAVGAAAVALTHEPTRRKLKSALLNAVEKGEEKLDEATTRVEDIKTKTAKKASRELEKVQKRLDTK